jgi:aryl-alcohol dehydrogenase-like predicted oxidoreductase
MNMKIPLRTLGKSDMEVTVLGLGGEGVLRTFGHDQEAHALINRAIDLGINYFESARAYSGSEAYYGRALKERRKDIFLASKSHARDRKGAMSQLQETLRNMRTEYLDLWQVHDVREMDDVREILGPGGAIEAFAEAKEKGLVRYVGVTGHHDPEILIKCIEMFDFDTVLLPVNPAEPFYKSFPDKVIPVAQKKKMGIVGMKVYFRGFASKIPWYENMEPFLQFALSHPITTVVIGCDSVEQLEENVRFVARFKAMQEKQMETLVEKISPFARQLMYYKP